MERIGISLSEFPAELRPFLAGAELFDASGHSGAQVLYAVPDYYLKIHERGELEQEAQNADWLFRQGLGPQVVRYLSGDRDYLLTRRAEGQNGLAWLEEPEALCAALAGALRRLHGLSPAGLPVSPRLDRYRESAEDRDGGYWDESVQMPEFPISSRDEAWAIMQAGKYRLRCDVPIHGDFCLPNVILAEGRFSALIDPALAGVGDRHIDLYWAVWSLWHYLGTGQYTRYFLRCYGAEGRDYDSAMLRVAAAFECFG